VENRCPHPVWAARSRPGKAHRCDLWTDGGQPRRPVHGAISSTSTGRRPPSPSTTSPHRDIGSDQRGHALSTASTRPMTTMRTSIRGHPAPPTVWIHKHGASFSDRQVRPGPEDFRGRESQRARGRVSHPRGLAAPGWATRVDSDCPRVRPGSTSRSDRSAPCRPPPRSCDGRPKTKRVTRGVPPHDDKAVGR